MIKATVRPSLSINPGWVDFLRPTLRLINEPLSRHISGRRNDRKAKRDAFKLKSPKRSFFPIPAAATLRPDRSHDLLVAVAELGALEQRIGYRFNDKLLGLSAFKTSPADYPVKFQSLSASFEDWKRLALLGDRALDLALCHTWYQSGNSRLSYALMEERLVTRWALARKGLRIHLDRNILTNGNSISHHTMGEAFEALIGAIYLDSQSDLHAVQKVLRNIGFSEVQTDVGTSAAEQSKPQEGPSPHSTLVTVHSDPVDKLSSAPARQMQIEPHLQPAPIQADNTNAIGDYESQMPSVATGVSLGCFYLKDHTLIRNPHMLSISQDLAEIFLGNPSHLQLLKNQEKLGIKILGDFRKCFEVYDHVIDLCSWFPALQTQYAQFYGVHLNDRTTSWGLAKRRYYCFFDSSFTAKEQPPLWEGVKKRATINDILNRELLRATNTRHKTPLKIGTVVEIVRLSTDRGESDALLTALCIEERVRDYIRRQAGFPGWYDLPENRDKILPPWRVSPPEFRPHAETVIPVEILLQSESFLQPPLLLDTVRQPESQSDTITSYHEPLARSDCVRFAYRERGDYRLSPSRSIASSASTVVAKFVSSEKNAGLLQHSNQVHPYATGKKEEWWSKKRLMHQSNWLYFCGSPLSAGRPVRRKNNDSRAQTADFGPKGSVAKSVTTSIETDSIQTVPIAGPLSPHSGAWINRWCGKALNYLYNPRYNTHQVPTALTTTLGYIERPTDLSKALYTSFKSPLLRGQFVTRNSGFEITDLSVSNRIEPYSSCNPTDGILKQGTSNTESMSAKPTIADTTTSSRRPKRVSVTQKPYGGRRLRSAIASTEKYRRQMAPAKPQGALSRARESGPRGLARPHTLIRKNDPYPGIRPPISVAAPFWQKRSPEDGTTADTAPRSMEAQNLINLVCPDHATESDNSEAHAVDSATKPANTHTSSLGKTSNQSSDVDNRNQDPGFKALHEPKDQPDRPKTAFGKLSAMMTGNKVWYEEQVSKTVPTFTSFDPVKRASALKQEPGLKDPFARDPTTSRSARSGGTVEESTSEGQKTGRVKLVRRVT